MEHICYVWFFFADSEDNSIFHYTLEPLQLWTSFSINILTHINFSSTHLLNLEEEMETYSYILAWKIPWTKEAGGLTALGITELSMTEYIHTHILECFQHVKYHIIHMARNNV